MKKLSIVIILLIVSILLCGCEEKTKKEVIINGNPINTDTMEHKHCTREGILTGGEVKLEYDIYYTGDILNIVESKEQVISPDDSILNTYEEAYKRIHANYVGLDYYDTSVVRGDTTVTSNIKIDYDNVDVDAVIAIEGEENNVFENKVAKVSKWLELAKKFGTKCELVED